MLPLSAGHRCNSAHAISGADALPVCKKPKPKCFDFYSSAAERAFSLIFTRTFCCRISSTARLPNCGEPLAFPLPMANNAYLCNICAVTVVLRQKGNPQAIQPLHLPAWTKFPYLCLLTGVKQVLGWETSWEIQLLQAQTNERGAEMGSRCYLTTTEGIWQRAVLTLYFNSSRPMTGEIQVSQRRWETGHPPPSNLDF